MYNHHWALHIRQQILDYGPVYGFWAFLTERLNFVLKQFKLNKWDRGRLEISMMRSFGNDSAVGSMVRFKLFTTITAINGLCNELICS